MRLTVRKNNSRSGSIAFISSQALAVFLSITHQRFDSQSYTRTGFWLLASGFWLLASGFWLLASGFWLLASGFWLLASGFWLLASGFWLLASGT
ncbi:hypothetical protein, partial [Lonsdalea quercina]|uniref:hypothetical protein n=1 Tax=Lonsdalea quercina TaxID=71657 RepID=UPI003975D633